MEKQIVFVSSWDDGRYHVESNARFDPKTGKVFDVEVADLPDCFLEELEILDEEYVLIDDIRYEIEENEEHYGEYYVIDWSENK